MDSAIELKPGDPDVYLRAMGVYVRANRLGDAAEVGELLAERSKNSVLARRLSSDETAALYARIGGLQFEAKNLNSAETAYTRALELVPDNGMLMNDLGYLYAEQGTNLRGALRLTRKAVEMLPDDGTVLDSLGWVQYKLRDYPSAVKTLEKAVRLSPDDPEIRYHLGAAYVGKRQTREALIELNKALLLDKSLEKARAAIRELR